MAAYTTIDDPSAYFKVQLFTGTGSENVITFNDTDTDMQPDMVWTKSRSNALNHNLYDSVRGVNKGVKPNTTDAEFDDAQTLKSFNSDGFTVGTDSHINTSSATYVAWCWKESATAGFDIVAYTGTGSAKTEAHSLSAVPHLMIVKNRETGSESWLVYHASQGNGKALKLDTTTAVGTNTAFWNDTTPTSSVFTIGTDGASNENTKDHIAYLWSEKQGFSKAGSWIGNGNADGPFVFCGFRPAMIIGKNTSRTEDWFILDAKSCLLYTSPSPRDS